MSRQHAEARYRTLNALAFGHAAQTLARDIGTPLRLEGIGPVARAEFAGSWRDHPDRPVEWPWPDMVEDYRHKFPARFELSIWSGETLCGLSLGKPSPSQDRLSIQYLEGNPNDRHPLKGRITLVMVEAAFAYARVLGAQRLLLDRPTPQLVPMYRKLGFRLVETKGQSAYCEQEVP